MADLPGINAPLRPADHVLAHALTALVAMRVPEAAQVAMLQEVLKDAGPAARAARHPQIAPLLEAARALLTTRAGTGERVRAEMQAAKAVEEFSMWRLGLALERMQGDLAHAG